MKPIFFELVAGQTFNLAEVQTVLLTDNVIYVNMVTSAHDRAVGYADNAAALAAYGTLLSLLEKNGVKIIP